jgi:hypothetical protein
LFGLETAMYIRESKEKADVIKILGIVLIVVGLAGLAYGGFTYTTRESIVDIGPIHASREKTHNIPLSPIAGGIALLGGIALIVTNKN